MIKAGTERRKGDRTKDRLGYTPEKFKERIEFNFKPGMSWDNHGEWHVDHVKPIARFVEQGVTDAKMITVYQICALCGRQKTLRKVLNGKV